MRDVQSMGFTAHLTILVTFARSRISRSHCSPSLAHTPQLLLVGKAMDVQTLLLDGNGMCKHLNSGVQERSAVPHFEYGISNFADFQ